MALNNESYQVYQGTALDINVVLNDADGEPISDLAGTEPLSCVVWPGGRRAASFAPDVTWLGTDPATIQVSITATHTASVLPGLYQLLVKLTLGDGSIVNGYSDTIEVYAAPGTDAEPSSYCTYENILGYSRGWLKQLQNDDDQAGFAEQRHRARTWIEDLAHAHFRTATLAVVVGGVGLGPRRSSARSTWLQDQLDADFLMLTDQVLECSAKKALALICEGQIGVGSDPSYGKLARMYHSQADYLGGCLVLSLDTDGDGEPDITIDCTSCDALYG